MMRTTGFVAPVYVQARVKPGMIRGTEIRFSASAENAAPASGKKRGSVLAAIMMGVAALVGGCNAAAPLQKQCQQISTTECSQLAKRHLNDESASIRAWALKEAVRADDSVVSLEVKAAAIARGMEDIQDMALEAIQTLLKGSIKDEALRQTLSTLVQSRPYSEFSHFLPIMVDKTPVLIPQYRTVVPPAFMQAKANLNRWVQTHPG